MAFRTREETARIEAENEAVLARIADRFAVAAADVREVKYHFEDVLAIGRVDASFPGRIAVGGSDGVAVFDSGKLSAKVRADLIRPGRDDKDEEVAFLQYGHGKLQFAKPISERYDRLDAMDDFQIGIQRHLRDVHGTDYREEMFPLNRDGRVAGRTRDLASDPTVREWAREAYFVRMAAQREADARGISASQNYVAPRAGGGEVLATGHLSGSDAGVLAVIDSENRITAQKFFRQEAPEIGSMVSWRYAEGAHGATEFTIVPPREAARAHAGEREFATERNVGDLQR